MPVYEIQSPRLYADFNGLFGRTLCLSHSSYCKSEHGEEVELRSGMIVMAYDEDADERGQRDWLIATGIVIPSPDWLECRGSVWCLEIDDNGVRSESEI